MIHRLRKKGMLLVVAAGLFYLVYHYFASPPRLGHQAHIPQVSVATVLEKKVQQWKAFSGRLSAIDQVEVRPRVSGMIESVHFKNGAIVQKGDLLFKIDPRPYEAQVMRAQGTVASTAAQVELARTELERAERLIAEKVISLSEYDTRKNAYHVLLANLRSAKAALDAAKLDVEFTQVKAPITGRISRAEMTVGNLIEAGVQVLATLVSSHPIYADFEVDEHTFLQYAQQKATGLHVVRKIPVMMELATGKDFSRIGYIESFDNALNSTSGTIRVCAVFDNPDLILVPGLFARIKLGDPTKTQATLITDRAIGTDQNKKFVLVVDQENKVGYRQVKLGSMVEGLRIIEEGLKPGEKIIVNGLQRARPGQQVVPESVPMLENEKTA